MPDFTLNLNISQEDLPTLLQAGLNITLAKPVNGQSNVAWQVFRPFPVNTVEWEETYGLYASNTLVNNGATITQISSQNPAMDNAVYPFTMANVFGPKSQPGSGEGTYSITNQNNNQPTLTFGLTQGASVNNTATGFKPVNAQSVPYKLNGEFTPLTTIYAWVQANIVSETVVTQVTSVRTKVVFGGTVTTQTLVWDASRGAFVSATGLAADLELEAGRLVYELADGVELLAPMIL